MICDPAEWKRRVCLQGCAIHTEFAECEGTLEAHHIITQQALRKRGFTWSLWDTRNGLPICAHRHAQHTRAIQRIPYEALPQSAIEFANEVGLEWQLERYYPRTEEK